MEETLEAQEKRGVDAPSGEVIKQDELPAVQGDSVIVSREILDIKREELPDQELAVVPNIRSNELTAKKEPSVGVSTEEAIIGAEQVVLEKGELDLHDPVDQAFIRGYKEPTTIKIEGDVEVIKEAQVYRILEPHEIDPKDPVDKEFIRDFKSKIGQDTEGAEPNEKPLRVFAEIEPESERIHDLAEANLNIEEVADDKPKKTSIGQRFLSILKTGGELGKNLLENSRLIAGELIEKAKPKVEAAINKARDIAEEAGHIAGGLAIKGGGVLKEKAGDVANFLKESGIALKVEIGSNLESAISLATDTFEKISNSDVVQGAVDRISIFKSSMAEAWVGSRVDQFNEFIKQEEVKV